MVDADWLAPIGWKVRIVHPGPGSAADSGRFQDLAKNKPTSPKSSESARCGAARSLAVGDVIVMLDLASGGQHRSARVAPRSRHSHEIQALT